jgi:glycosyltransferase involved in cell wall biosynthesis
MKIAIDAGLGLTPSEKGGIYYLLPQFLSALHKIDRENEYVISGYFLRNYHKRIQYIKEFLAPEIFSFKILPLPSKIVNLIEVKMKFPLIEKFLKKEGISIYHGFCSGNLPIFNKIRTVYTVHDLSFEFNPDFYKDRWYRYVKNSTMRADVITTPSFSSKKDLVRIYNIPEDKIKVIYLGVNQEIFKPISKEVAHKYLKKYLPFERYILTVATSIKRKNIPFLLDVYKILKKKGIEEKFVIIAGTLYLKDEILKLATEKKIENDTFVLTEIPVNELPFFYSGAELFVFLSLYEGFGLPVLEAMACGCPVITSNISSLPEIAGDAGIIVNPYSLEESSTSILNTLSDEILKSEKRKKGIERASLFSWEKCARETLEVYRELSK